MKKFLAVLLAMFMVLSLAACSGSKKEEGASTDVGDEQVSESKPDIFGDSDVLEVTEGDFSYTLTYIPDSPISVCVTKYNGLDTEVTIPNQVKGYGVNAIGEQAFAQKMVTSVTIPDGVNVIGEAAFFGCHNLTEVVMPDSVTSIGESAFAQCRTLSSATLPKNLVTIGKNAFYDCDMTEVVIPDSVTSVGDGAFTYCVYLKKVILPKGIKSIGESMFFLCNSLTEIEIPDGVESIGKNAFFECKSLTEITIPDSVTSIGMQAFFSCYKLETVYFESEAQRDKFKPCFYSDVTGTTPEFTVK